MFKQLLTGGSVSVLLLATSIPALAGSAPARPTSRPSASQLQTQPAQSQPASGSTTPGAASQSPAESTPAPAEVSAAEVQQFASAIKQLRSIQQEAQGQAGQIIQSQGLTVDRFNEILQSQQNPQSQPSNSVSNQERQKFEQALTKVAELQRSTQQRMEQAVQGQGLNVQRFNQILAMARQNPDLRQRIQQQIQR